MDEEQKIAGVNRNVFFLGLVSFFNDFSAEMIQSVMPVFLTTVLGAPAFVVGLIEGVADALASVLKVISGWISDRVQKRKMPAVIGYAISVSVRPFLAAVTSFWQVLGLRVVDRVGKGFRDAPRDALIAESSDPREFGRSYGFHRSLDTLGATVGPLLAFVMLPLFHGSFRTLFLFAFVIGIGALLSFLFVRESPHGALKKSERPRLNWDLFKTNRRFAWIVFSLFIFGLGTLPISLALLKVKEIGLPLGDFPLVYFIYSLVFVLVAVPLGRFADRIGERAVIAGGFLIAAIVYLGLSRSTHPLIVLFCFMLLGVYAAATDGLERALAAKHVRQELLATGQGFLNMAIGFSSLGAGVIGGLLWTEISSAAAFLYAGALSAIGLVLFLFMTQREQP